MRGLFTNGSHLIEAGQAVSGVATKEATLRVVRGRAWATVEGVSHDYWLQPGCTLQAIPGHLTVIEADAKHGDLELRIERTPSSVVQLAAGLLHAVRRLAGRKNRQSTIACPSIH